MTKRINLQAAVLLLLLLASCKANKFDLVEPQKDISGDWKVTRIVQNSIDITSEVDLSAFRLTFNKNNYSLSNPIPFIISKNGTWAFNDPTYPFALTFTSESGTIAKSDLVYSTQQGQRTMRIKFNTGCDNNEYEYLLFPAN